MKPGSHEESAKIAAAAFLALGATNLQAKVGTEIASRGDTNWLTDAQLRAVLKRWDGRPYHRESIGRARRMMKRRGWIGSERVYPTQKPRGAKFSSTYGTTTKWIIWKNLGVKNPMTRGERRERRAQQVRAERIERLMPSVPPRRRYTALEPSLVGMVAGIGKPPVPATIRRSPTDPIQPKPTQANESELSPEERRAEAKRRLEEWAKEHDPPSSRKP